MTPCEKMGYKAGDEFEVIGNGSGEMEHEFELGEEVVLVRDDGSCEPRFEKITNREFWQFVNLSDVRPINTKPLTKQLTEAVAKRDKFKRKADKWAQRFADQAAEVSRIAGGLEKEIEGATGCGCSINPDVRDMENTIPDDVYPDNPKTWREGDVVECVCINGCRWAREYLTEGVEYKFCEYDPDEGLPFWVVYNDGDKLWTSAKLRFVRRASEG